MKIELTQEIVRELLHYDPETGLLYWKERDVKWFKDGYHKAEHICKYWNSKFAGKEAFTFITPTKYLQGAIFNKRYQAHRIIWLWMTGEWPDVIDHRNGNRLDNSWKNIQSVTQKQNTKNQGMRSNNKSGYKGVSWDRFNSKWKAQITVYIDWRSVNKNLGRFDTPDEAFAAYCKAAEKFGFTERHIYG